MSQPSASYDKNRLADLLKTIYDFTKLGASDSGNCRRCKILGGSGTRICFSSDKGAFEGVVPDGHGPTLMIFDDGADAYEQFVTETLKDGDIKNLVGADAIEQQLDTLLRSTGGKLPERNLQEVVRYDVLKPLRDGIQDWVTYVPIENLVVRVPLRLGDVNFVSADFAREECQRFFDGFRFAGDVERQATQTQGILKHVDAACNDVRAFAKVALHAYDKKADDVAAAKALVAVNILRSHTHLLFSPGKKALIGLPTEITRGSWKSISIGQGNERPFQLQDKIKGYLVPFVLDQPALDHLVDKCHLGLIQEILDIPASNRNSLQSAIIQAFQALGRAIVAPTIDMRFLGCTIALERMLIRDREESTTERWSDRLAVVLGEDPGQRQSLIQRAKGLYDLRSRIVHAAYSGVSDVDARLMEEWAMRVILSTVERYKDFSSHEEFCRKIDPREIGLSSGGNIS